MRERQTNLAIAKFENCGAYRTIRKANVMASKRASYRKRHAEHSETWWIDPTEQRM